MNLFTRARSFVRDLFSTTHEPMEFQEPSSYIRGPSLMAALTQISLLVQMHREKNGYPQIMLLVNDPEAMTSIIDHINDTWVQNLNAPPEITSFMGGPIVDVDIVEDCQFARLGGVDIFWPLPGKVWEDA